VERLVGVAADGAGWLAVPGSASRVLRNLAVIDDMTWQRTSEAATRLSTKYDWNEVAAAYEQAYTSVASRRG